MLVAIPLTWASFQAETVHLLFYAALPVLQRGYEHLGIDSVAQYMRHSAGMHTQNGSVV